MASVAAKVLLDAGLMERCLVLLQAILQHWKSNGSEETPVVAGLLKRPLTLVFISITSIRRSSMPPDALAFLSVLMRLFETSSLRLSDEVYTAGYFNVSL